MNNDPTNYDPNPERLIINQVPEKRKIVKPAYKEKWEVAERKISILWRVIIGLIVISLALGSLAVVVMLNLK